MYREGIHDVAFVAVSYTHLDVYKRQEDGEVEINEPIAFNMEQEELALRGTHNLYNSLEKSLLLWE